MNYFQQSNYTFLDSSESRNSKTYYYLRLCIYHNIPLIVHCDKYKRDLKIKAVSLGDNPNKEYQILSVTDTTDLLLIRELMSYSESMIIDNKIAFNHLMQFDTLMRKMRTNNTFMSDDEIRELILYDMSQGKEYIYE